MNIEFIRPQKVLNSGKVLCCITTGTGGYSALPYGLNMSLKVNDNPEAVFKNRNAVYSALGISNEKIVLQKQIHSANISYVTEGGTIPANDALITDKKNLFLAVSVADCYPVFLADTSHKAVAAIHSGWRGTEKNITGLTVEKLKNKFEINPVELFAYIGPGICAEHFEVGREVFEKFPENVRHSSGEKYYVDLRKNIFNQLIKSGLKNDNIEVSGLCTYGNPILHSYRRDREVSGRMFGFIGLLP